MSDRIERAYLRWRCLNPSLYSLFIRYARDVAAVRTHYGIGSLTERIRWHVQVESRGDDFKINNNYRALIARDLMTEGYVPDDFFELRRRTAAQR